MTVDLHTYKIALVVYAVALPILFLLLRPK